MQAAALLQVPPDMAVDGLVADRQFAALPRFAEAQRGITCGEHRHLVAAAVEAIGAIDHAHAETGQVLLGEATDETREIA